MRVVVVGGGLAGLFTASELVAAGVDDLLVVDRDETPGGVVRTVERDGFALEPGAGSFNLPHPHLGPILDRIGAEVSPAGRKAVMRYLYVDGRLIGVPPSPRALLAPVVPLRSKLRALAEPLLPSRSPDDESLAEFCRRRFGPGSGHLLSWLMASGVFAGDPDRLSAQSAFPMLHQMERDHGSILRGALRHRRARPDDAPRPRPHVPSGGMAGLASAAASHLGHRYRAGFEVRSVRPVGGRWIVEGSEDLSADAVVLACRPEAAAGVVDGRLSDVLSRAKAAPVVVVGLGGEEGSVPEGFGALVGPDEGMASLGVLFESSYAPHRAPPGSWMVKVIAGGASRAEVADWDDDRLVDRVTGEASRVLGRRLQPSYAGLMRHRPGIPQYEVGHRDWLESIDRHLAEQPGLHLTGWGYRGVGVAHIATDAARVAAEIAGGQAI